MLSWCCLHVHSILQIVLRATSRPRMKPQQQKNASDHCEKKSLSTPEQQALRHKQSLQRGVNGFMRIILRIQAYYWLYAFYALYAVCETIVLFAWDLIASIFNIILPIVHAPKIKRTSLFAGIIIAGFTIIIQDFEYFDVSSLYHFFRGQNTVKLYSVGLSIMIFEIMLTTTGKTYFQKLPKIFINSETKPGEIWLELILSFLYSLIHFLIIYIDFVLFVIMLNSTTSNRFLYLFSTNVGKLKAFVFKKFDKKIYKNNLLFDAKDRFHKLTFSIIFMLTMEERIDLQLCMTIVKALAFSSVIDYLRSLVFLSSGEQLTLIRDLRNKFIEQVYLTSESIDQHETVMKCLQMDFTVIPYILFIFKFIHIVCKQIIKMDFNLIVTYIFIVLLLFLAVAKIALWVLRKYHPLKQQPKQAKQEKQEKQKKQALKDE